MQAFYARLMSSPDSADSYLRCLTRLTQLKLGRLAALRSELEWNIWNVE